MNFWYSQSTIGKKNQNSGYLWEAGVGWEWELPEKGHEGTFGGDVHVTYLDED